MGAWNNVWQVCRSHRCIPESLVMVLARASLLLSLWLGWPKTISDLMSSSVLICTHQPSHNFPLDKSKSQHTKLLMTESWTYYISSASLAMREGTRSWLMNFYVFFQSTKYVRFCGFHRRFRLYKPPELAAAMWAGCPTRPLDAHFTQSAYGFFFSDLFAQIMCVRSSARHCWVFFAILSHWRALTSFDPILTKPKDSKWRLKRRSCEEKTFYSFKRPRVAKL